MEGVAMRAGGGHRLLGESECLFGSPGCRQHGEQSAEPDDVGEPRPVGEGGVMLQELTRMPA